MTKQKKFKGNQATYNVAFEGTDRMLYNVLVKEVDIGQGNAWAILEERGKRWTMLTTPGYLIEPMSDDDQVIEFDRRDPNKPRLVTAFGEDFPIGIHTQLSLGERRKFYSIDESTEGTRLQYTDNIIAGDDHHLIQRIRFTKVTK